MPNIELGSYALFTVLKEESDYYLIRADKVTLKLDKKDATKPLSLNEKIEVFLYADTNKNLAATMNAPKIDVHNAALVKVVEAKFGLGVFVDIGLEKDMLVSRDELPVLKKQWPKIGDYLFCYMKTGKNQLSARLVSRFKMQDYFTPENPLEEKAEVEAYVFYIGDEGLVLFTDAGHEIFVYYKHARSNHRLGEKVTVNITIEKDALHYNGRLTMQKELMLDDDAERIVILLEENDGVIELGDKSDPDAIFEALHMSKAAFKRALGTLYKAGKVDLEKTKTTLKNN